MVRYSNYTQLLRSKLAERQALNPHYSLRAFARDLGLAPSRVSEILSGKQRLSAQRAETVSQALHLNPQEKEIFVLQAAAEASRSHRSRRQAREALSKIALEHPVSELAEDQFHVISDWYHFAILELLLTEGFQSDAGWIAGRLGITSEQAKLALERLLRLRVVKRVGKRFVSTCAQLETTKDIPSESIHRFNQQILDHAKRAVIHQSVQERYLSTLTVAIHPDDIDDIKAFLLKKRRLLNRKLTERSKVRKPPEVYVLATQFFRLTQPLLGERK